MRLACQVLTVSTALTLAGCAAAGRTRPTATPTIGCASGELAGQGSTAQAAAMTRWLEQYHATCPHADVRYEANGSGAGQQAFIAASADFAGSDSPLSTADQAKANNRCRTGQAIHLPMLIGPVAVVYNLAGVKDLQFKPATLAKVFSGNVTRWNADEIKADNPVVPLPDAPIETVHRSDSSGTTDNFTSYLAATAPSEWRYGSGKTWQAPGGTGQAGSRGVGDEVTLNSGAISYVEWSVAQTFKLNIAKIYDSAGQYATLTSEAAGKTIANSDIVGSFDDLKLKLNYFSTVSGAYPIVQVTYEIICNKGNAPERQPLLKAFLTYLASGPAQASAGDLGYAPLPAKMRKAVTASVGLIG